MGEDLIWRKTCEADYLHNCQNHLDLHLIYGRIYTPGFGYSHSKTNQLIHNLKKPITASDAEIHYKHEAIKRFAQESVRFLHTHSKKPFKIVPMPSSKKKSNPEYDDRIERVAKKITQLLTGKAIYWEVLYSNTDREAVHQNNQCRSSELIYQSMSIDDDIANQNNDCDNILVIDDVLTSGAHFFAAHQHLSERFQSAKIAGLFWAKSQDSSDFIPSSC